MIPKQNNSKTKTLKNFFLFFERIREPSSYLNNSLVRCPLFPNQPLKIRNFSLSKDSNNMYLDAHRGILIPYVWSWITRMHKETKHSVSSLGNQELKIERSNYCPNPFRKFWFGFVVNNQFAKSNPKP